MLWLKAFHIIAAVAWFSGLFYLPRLFVYHTMTAAGSTEYARFCLMEKRLYRCIMTPAMLVALACGFGVLYETWAVYKQAGWMHTKLACVVALVIYHIVCGHYVQTFAQNKNQHRERFYRLWNEVPTVFLIAIVILATVKPF